MDTKTQNAGSDDSPDARRTPKAFCRAAFGQLHISIGGDVKPCCEFTTPIGNLQKQSLKNIWFSEPLAELRKKMLRGEPDSRCWKCDEKEDADVYSLRDMYNAKDFLGNARYWSQAEHETDLPKALDLRFSNLCNLSCRTCGPEASTKWHSDATKLGWWGRNPQGLNETFASTAAAIETLSPVLGTIDEIYFAGGEPLLHDGHYAVLNELIRLGRTHVRLYYSTNLTSLHFGDKNVLPLWSRFKSVHLGASIDGYEKQGELIRQGLSWRRFTENVSIVRTQCPHVRLRFAITVSALNVLSLPDLCEHLLAIEPTDGPRFTFNILQEPRYYSIQILPPQMKLTAKRRLEDYGEKYGLQDELAPIIRFMMFEDRTNELGTFRSNTFRLDKLRHQNTAKIIPEIAPLLRRPRPGRVIGIAARAVAAWAGAVRGKMAARMRRDA
jgi:radical SAM protein with 4Fe4S-binding SPASM domain